MVVLSQIYSKTSAHNFIKIYSDLTSLSHIVLGVTFFVDSVVARVISISSLDNIVSALFTYFVFLNYVNVNTSSTGITLAGFI